TGGGSSSAGAVWELTPGTGGEYTEGILESFTWNDGSAPYAGVVRDSSGNIYGTTQIGVKSPCYDGCGTVFELEAGGTTYQWKILWPFDGTDGGYPSDSLILEGQSLRNDVRRWDIQQLSWHWRLRRCVRGESLGCSDHNRAHL